MFHLNNVMYQNDIIKSPLFDFNSITNNIGVDTMLTLDTFS